MIHYNPSDYNSREFKIDICLVSTDYQQMLINGYIPNYE